MVTKRNGEFATADDMAKIQEILGDEGVGQGPIEDFIEYLYDFQPNAPDHYFEFVFFGREVRLVVEYDIQGKISQVHGFTTLRGSIPDGETDPWVAVGQRVDEVLG